MGSRRGDTPEGKTSGKLPDNVAMDAMMFDLGNNRLEDLATDADDNKPRGRQNFQAERRLAPMQGEDCLINPGAEKWRNAVRDGVFDDHDSRAVRGLDPLDDGNAHRRNGAPQIPTSRAQHARNPEDAGKVNREARQRNYYNPANPGYSRSKPRQSSQPLGQNFRETSLGGHVPPGGEIRRWDPSGPARVTAAANAPGVGRGASPGAPVQGAQQHAFSEGGGRGRGAPQRLQQPSFGTIRPGHTHVSATAQKSLPKTQSPTTKAPTSRPSTAGPSTTQPKVVNSTLTEVPSVIVSQYDKGETLEQSSGISGHVPKQVSAGGAKISGNNAVEQSNQLDGNAHLPHLRQTPRQVLPQTDEFAVSIPSQKAQASGNGQAQSITPLKLGKVIFCEKVTAVLAVGVDVLMPGQVTLYKQTQETTAVWEISMDDGRLLRGDIRTCIPPFLTGSAAYLRRHDHPTALVQSSLLRFDSIPTATRFKQAANDCLEQMKNSTKPKLKETLVDKSRPIQPSGDLRVEPDKIAEIKTISFAETSPGPPRGPPVSTEKLIDFNSSKSFKGIQSHSSELEGLHYQAPRAAQPESSLVDLSKLQKGPISAESNIGTFPVVIDEQEPIAQSGTSLPPVAAQDKTNVVTQAMAPTLYDLDAIEATPLGRDMSQDSLRMLSTVTGQEYRGMIEECHSVVPHFGSRKTLRTMQWLKKRALRVTVGQLMRHDNFRALAWDERMKVCAVVYAIVLLGDSPIIRSREEMMDLRLPTRPCPDVIHRFNNYVRSTASRTDSNLPQASIFRNFARSPFTVSRDTGAERREAEEEEQHRLEEEERRAEEQRRREEEEQIATTGQQRIEAEQHQAEEENERAATQSFVEFCKHHVFFGSSTLTRDDAAGRGVEGVVSTGPSEKTNDQAPATVSNGSAGQNTSREPPHLRGISDSIHDSQQGESQPGFGAVTPASPTSPDYEITNSPVSASRASARDPRGSFLYASNISPGPLEGSGLSASRWAVRERKNSSSESTVSSDDAPPGGIDANTWNRHNSTGLSVSHSRSDIGDLSSLSGLNGEFGALELSDDSDSDWEVDSCCSW
ncbi:hypothetical protein F4776DRAFT_658669 [Hypoxylon sp. NC0597]|nr:hypothetical protein F4776DRAFT_658669 [Hypoxylon sp. NC0597]